MRPGGRVPDELRAVSLERGIVKYAEGSCMVKFGDTHVLVTATLEERLPPWLKGQGRGWVTAEYGMLPRATLERTRREASAGKQNGRTVEIQRLIGRSLRATLDLEALGERQITVDCDVLQAGARPRLRRGFGGRYRRQFCHDRRWPHHRGAGHGRKDPVLAGRIPGADGASAQGRGAAGGPAENGSGVSRVANPLLLIALS